MRELLVKNFLSKDKKRKELFLSEHYEKEGIIQEIEKRTVYRVRAVLEFTDIFDLELYLNRKNSEGENSCQRFIVRSHNNKTGAHKFIYKTIGNQYVVADNKVIVLYVTQFLKRTIVRKSTPSSLTNAA